jgi:uncharacterized protein with FMN-binding domain
MRRAPIVLSATALGLAATLGFHPRATTTLTTAAAQAGSGSTTATPTPSSTTPSSATSSASSSKTTTVTGDAASTPYGVAQVRVTIKNGKIADITAVQLPSNDPHSQQIAAAVEPMLRQSVLTAQSANIDVVSGATYTSTAYKSSLQSALDKAGFTTASPTA